MAIIVNSVNTPKEFTPWQIMAQKRLENFSFDRTFGIKHSSMPKKHTNLFGAPPTNTFAINTTPVPSFNDFTSRKKTSATTSIPDSDDSYGIYGGEEHLGEMRQSTTNNWEPPETHHTVTRGQRGLFTQEERTAAEEARKKTSAPIVTGPGMSLFGPEDGKIKSPYEQTSLFSLEEGGVHTEVPPPTSKPSYTQLDLFSPGVSESYKQMSLFPNDQLSLFDSNGKVIDSTIGTKISKPQYEQTSLFLPEVTPPEPPYEQGGLFTPQEREMAQAAREGKITTAPVEPTKPAGKDLYDKFVEKWKNVKTNLKEKWKNIRGSSESALDLDSISIDEQDMAAEARRYRIADKHKYTRSKVLEKTKDKFKDVTSKIDALTPEIEKAQSSFLGKKGSKGYKTREQALGMLNSDKAREEAKAFYAQKVEDAKLLGEKFEVTEDMITDRMYHNVKDKYKLSKNEMSKLKTITEKQGELQKLAKEKARLTGHLKNYNDHGRFTRSTGVIGEAAEKAAKSGWKGKAAIFGGVAAAALATVGIGSLMMSGGRQSNSNLYNPYQAMY